MDMIIGAKGQLGAEMCKLLDEKQVSYQSTNSSEMDITDKEKVTEIITKLKPNFIYLCAAYTQVDKAEDEGKELNQKVNVEGTRNVATIAEAIGATLIFISTDYVFDGTKHEPYQVSDITNPQNEYGRAKLQAEELVKSICSKFYIIRTSWVFGEFGNNFVYTMKKLAENNSSLTVINDQFGRPTWTRTLAEFMLFLKNDIADYGIYHLSNDNFCSWYEFSKEILKFTDVEIKQITSGDYPQKAFRPRNSILDLTKTKDLGFDIPTWQDALKLFTKSIS